MDKQEYRVILEEINKAYLDENYDRVLMIAQELDVKKIGDNHILEIIADSYEQMGRTDIAREVLLVAYERTPMGRQMAYKLCDISIKMNDLDNAAEFYHDFCRMAPNDSKKYILKYEIGKKGGVARKNLVEVLEAYCEKEMDEKYKYELANLYRATGRKEECIELCDEIMLWFADGAYAKKAQKLKDACLGILQQNNAPKRRGTLSLFDDENIEDISEEDAKQYNLQPKSEEIFDDAPAVEIQRLEDKPLMNENVSWRVPNKEYEPVITESKPKLNLGKSVTDFDDSYEEKVDDYENYYSGNKKQEEPEEKNEFSIIDESIKRGWTNPEDKEALELEQEFEDFDDFDDDGNYDNSYNNYDNYGGYGNYDYGYDNYGGYGNFNTNWEMPDQYIDTSVEEEFVEPVFGAHRPAHLRDDYVPPEEQQTQQNSPFSMPSHSLVNGNKLEGMPLQPVPPQSPAYQTVPIAPAPIYQQAPAYQEPVYQAPVYQEPANQAPAYQTPVFDEKAYEAPAEQPKEDTASFASKPFAFSIAPDAAIQNEISKTDTFVADVPNLSEKASLVKKPILRVGPVDEIKYTNPIEEVETPSDIPVVQYEDELDDTSGTVGAFTSKEMKQTSIPAPKTLSIEPVKVVMGPEGEQPSLSSTDGRVNLGWDDNWGGDFRTWGSLNMNDAPVEANEIDDEPDYFSTMLEIPKDKPTYGRSDVPFSQQVPQTKFVELKSGTPFADPRSILAADDYYDQESKDRTKYSGTISAALGASTVAAMALEPEENLTETQKAILAFGAGELTTDDLLERDDLDLGDDELNEDNAKSSGYRDNGWQEVGRPEFDDEDEFEDDFEDEFKDELDDSYNEGPELTEAEKVIMAFDAMNVSDNELIIDDDEFEDEFEEDEIEDEDRFVNYEDEFDEFDDQFNDTKKPKVNEDEWVESDDLEEDSELEEEFDEEFDDEFNEDDELEEEFDDNEESELSDAEKAILAFDAANGKTSEDEDFDFEDDFDDVFSGEFDNELNEEETNDDEEEFEFEEEINDDEEEFEFEEELDEEFDEEELEEDEEYDEDGEFDEEYDESEEFEEEYEEEFDDEEELEETKETDDEENKEEEESLEKHEVPKEDIEVELPDDLREELSEFFLVDGMEEKIESTLNNIVNAKNKGNKLDINLIVAGDPKSGKTYLTIALIKAIGKILGSGNGRVAKVPAAALRGKKMEKVFEKVAGSDLIIENIGYLDEDSIKDLIETLKSQKYDSMVVLEGNNLAIENLTSKFPEINEMFKNRLDIDELSLPQWADIASDYAMEQGYVIGDMASLALHAKIDELNVPTRRLGTADIMEIVDDAIDNANRRLSPKVIKKKRKRDEDIELVEEDFA